MSARTVSNVGHRICSKCIYVKGYELQPVAPHLQWCNGMPLVLLLIPACRPRADRTRARNPAPTTTIRSCRTNCGSMLPVGACFILLHPQFHVRFARPSPKDKCSFFTALERIHKPKKVTLNERVMHIERYNDDDDDEEVDEEHEEEEPASDEERRSLAAFLHGQLKFEVFFSSVQHST